MKNIFKINLSYDYETDESKLKPSKNWKELPSIHQLDALKDFIYDLNELYQKTYEEHISNYNEPLIGEALLQNMGHENPEGPLTEEAQAMIIEDISKQIN
jgi:hypothetical protein